MTSGARGRAKTRGMEDTTTFAASTGSAVLSQERDAIPLGPSLGSRQLRMFRRAYRDTGDLDLAAGQSGLSIGEARLTVAEDAKFPPPPEAFELLPFPDATAAASQPKENDMARGRKAREPEEDADTEFGEGAGIDGEYKRPDAAKAFEIFDKQIAPKLSFIAEKKGDLSQPYQDIKDQANFPRKVLDFIVKLEGEEDAKRDHLLLALAEGLRHRKLFLPRDLVTMAQGGAGADVIPTGERESGGLATLGDDDDFDEADEEELAAQEGRGKPRAASIASIKSPASEASAATH